MFLHPLGLFALAAVPAVVALHLYRRRYRPRTVSAVFLWSAEDRAPAAGRKREPLRRSASFWCEVLAALCLALVFAAPRPFGSGEARHLVLVLDRSASMGATAANGASTTERALEAARQRIDALPRGSRVTVIGSGARPEVLAGPAALPLEAREALSDFAPGRAHHALGPALALGFELSGANAVTLITDELDDTDAPPEVEVVAVGRPAANVAIVAAARGAERASLTVASFAPAGAPGRFGASAAAATRTLHLRTLAGAPLASREVTLAPGAESHVSFDLPDGTPLVVAQLEAPAGEHDGLAADDIAWLAPAPRRTLRLASTLPAELGALLGLDTAADPSNIDGWLALVPDAIDTINPSAAHLVLATGLIGGDAWVLGIAAPPLAEGADAGTGRAHFIGPFLTDPSHPLLGGVTLEGVVWSADPDATLQGAPFISAGALPLATEVREGARVAWLFNLDAARSNLHRSPDWPILLANAAEARRAALPGPATTTLALGEPLRYRAVEPTAFHWQRIAGPAGDLTPVDATYRASDALLLDDIELPGVYELRGVDAGAPSELLAEVGVSLSDRTESDLRERASDVRPATANEALIRAGFSWVELALLVAALTCIVLDWWVLRRPYEGARISGASPAPGALRGART
ncbi:MAG: VWA domain-containing protein [Planctomycetota bacterium]